MRPEPSAYSYAEQVFPTSYSQRIERIMHDRRDTYT